MKHLEIPEHIQAIIEAIRYHGGHTYLAGGAVRDHLLGMRRYNDLDFEVYNMHSDILSTVLSNFGNVDAVGRAFGVLILHQTDGHKSLEFTLPRRENKQGYGHRGFIVEVDPDMSTFEATRRRDFTMNSMLIDLHDGTLIDHHNGVRDLDTYILRATSTAYMEDPLRVLRGFQFVARYNLWPTDATINMSKHMLAEAKDLSVERIWGEWYKWATLGWEYLTSLEYLWVTNWITLYPELMALKGVEQDPLWHPEGDAWRHTTIVTQNTNNLANIRGHLTERRIQSIFAALLHDVGKPSTCETSETSGRLIHPKHELVGVDLAEKFLIRIGAPKWVGVKVLPLIREHMFRRGRSPETISKRAIRRLAVRLEPATIRELADLIQADTMNRVKEVDPFVSNMLRVAGEVKVEDAAPKKILRGQHLIDRGLIPGPNFGVVLQAAYEAQLDGAFWTEYGALVWLGNYLDGHPENL